MELGTLIVEKLVVVAFVVTSLFVLLSTRPVRAIKQACLPRILYICRPGFVVTHSVDTETVHVGVVLLMECVLVLGFCVPMLLRGVLPLCALSLAQGAAVSHRATQQEGVETRRSASPSTAYMWFSWCLGSGLVSWFFLACQEGILCWPGCQCRQASPPGSR